MSFLIPELEPLLGYFAEEAVPLYEAYVESHGLPNYIRQITDSSSFKTLGALGLLNYEKVKEGAYNSWIYQRNKYGKDLEMWQPYENISPIKRKYSDIDDNHDLDITLPLPIEDDTDMIVAHQVTDAVPVNGFFVKGKFKSKMENTKFYTRPIVVKHNASGAYQRGVKDLVLQGYRTKAIGCTAGRLTIEDDFSYNSKAELLNQIRIANNNYMMQNQTGYRDVAAANNTVGTSASMTDAVINNNVYAYCMMHKKTYRITNIGNQDVTVLLRFITNKTHTSQALDTCVSDTSYELNTLSTGVWSANNVLRYDTSIAGELTNVVSADLPHFNLFKHRYKVRKYWKQLGVRKCMLKPGHECTIPVMDSGPWMLSRGVLEELEAGQYPAGYFRIPLIELRGADIAWNSDPTNFTATTSGGSISIVEKTLIVLRANMRMQPLNMQFITTHKSDNTVGSYTGLGQILAANEREMNEENQTGQAAQNNS